MAGLVGPRGATYDNCDGNTDRASRGKRDGATDSESGTQGTNEF